MSLYIRKDVVVFKSLKENVVVFKMYEIYVALGPIVMIYNFIYFRNEK